VRLGTRSLSLSVAAHALARQPTLTVALVFAVLLLVLLVILLPLTTLYVATVAAPFARAHTVRSVPFLRLVVFLSLLLRPTELFFFLPPPLFNTQKMSAIRLTSSLRAATRQVAAARVARRGYAEAADDKLKLSLVLPHQVGVNCGPGFGLSACWEMEMEMDADSLRGRIRRGGMGRRA
jgi:hypothetical protein